MNRGQPPLPALKIGAPSSPSAHSSATSLQPPVTAFQHQPPSPVSPHLHQHRRDSSRHLAPSLGREHSFSSNHSASSRHRPTSSLAGGVPLNVQDAPFALSGGNENHQKIWMTAAQQLDSIEASMANGESNVFGPAHAKALEDLRAAQVQIAQAWIRSERDDQLDREHVEMAKKAFGRQDQQKAANGKEGTTKDGDAAGATSAEGSSGAKNTFTKGTNTTEEDIQIARRRRELNDAHFNRIQLSVMDVVEKLENVANAMGVVERESREIWGSEMSDEQSIR